MKKHAKSISIFALAANLALLIYSYANESVELAIINALAVGASATTLTFHGLLSRAHEENKALEGIARAQHEMLRNLRQK